MPQDRKLTEEEAKKLGPIEFLAQGYTNVQLAEALNLAEPGSAQDRVDRLIKRLSLRDRREVATFAGWCGLGPQPWIDPRTGQLKKTHK